MTYKKYFCDCTLLCPVLGKEVSYFCDMMISSILHILITLYFSCVDGTDNCKQDQSGKIKCQSCRIKKCIEVGMSPDSVGHKQKQKNIVNDSIKPKTNVNENSEILNKPQALINHLNFTKESVIILYTREFRAKIATQLLI